MPAGADKMDKGAKSLVNLASECEKQWEALHIGVCVPGTRAPSSGGTSHTDAAVCAQENSSPELPRFLLFLCTNLQILT